MLKKLWQWIKNPRGLLLIPLYLFSACVIACAIVLSVVGQDKGYDVLAYIFYVLAAVMLGYCIYTIVVIAPRIKENTLKLIKKNSFTNRLYEHYGFRTIIFAVISLAISAANAIFNGTVGIIYLSVWYLSLGAYYFLLALMRGGVLVYHKNKKKYEKSESETKIKIREIKSYRRCGALLILLPLALSFAIMEIVASGKAFVHSGIMIYVSALYTVYKVAASIKNFFKARKGDEATVKAIRNVNLADALVSVFALQTAMFHEFSPEESFGLQNAIVGAVVCALTAAIGIYMIIYATLEIKKVKLEEVSQNED
ncbi:MAG: hypothetical protein K2G37_05585 [Clostridia bacterium]|nr:hypothetical protein [Clostridia bacterium]MDE7329461.1 hypothetical protein [Clostridia bacterium]